MKLVISIPEDYFEEIKNGIGWTNFRPYHLITNGILLDDVLQEIRQEINDEFLRCDANAWSDIAKGLLSARCIIDRKIKELSE